MNKLKNLISKTSIEIKELIKNFPITMILVAFVTVLMSILVDQDFSESIEKLLEKIVVFCIIWGFGTYFTETYSFSKLKRIISYGITGAISLIFVKIGYSELEQYKDVLARMLGAYLITIFSITIYKTIRKQELKFSKYILNLFRDLLNNTITYGILAIGISILVVIFVQLILDGKYGSGLSRIHVLLFGLYYVSSLLYSISSINKKEINSFTKGLVLYVLLPLIIVAMLIIYLYIAKIFILRDMPKNIIFRILAGIFIVGFPVWNMASQYGEEKKSVQKITKILPVLYIPFLFLEVYSIGVRISEFGITPSRYIACAFIVFQIISVALELYRNKEKLDRIFIVIVIFGIVLLITPLNFENISNLSQKHMIEKLLKQNMNFENLADDEKTKVKSAYQYLKRQTNGEKYIPDYLTDEMIEQIKQYNTTISSYREDYHYFYDTKELDLMIEPYEQIVEVSGMVDHDSIVKLDEINQKVDLSELLNQIVKEAQSSESEAEKYFEENNLVYIDELHDLYIKNIHFDYSDENVKYLSVDGYWLTRRAEEYKKKSSKIVPEKNEDIEIQKDFNEAVNQLDKNVFLTDFENYSWASNEVKITENEAKEIAQKGFEESWRRIAGEGVDNIESQRIVMREESPNNYFTRYYFDGDKIYTDIKRNCYVVTRTNEMGNGISIYVDSNTGLIIGGEAFGD